MSERALRRSRRRPLLHVPQSLARALAASALGLAGLAFVAGVAVGRRAPEAPVDRVVLVVESRQARAAIAPAPPARVAPPAPETARVEPRASAVATSSPAVAAASSPAAVATSSDATVVAAGPAVELEILRAGPGSGYGLQLGAYATETEALTLVAEHAAELGGLPIYVLATELAERGTWYRVRVGHARSKAGAEALKKKLGAALSERAIVVSLK